MDHARLVLFIDKQCPPAISLMLNLPPLSPDNNRDDGNGRAAATNSRMSGQLAPRYAFVSTSLKITWEQKSCQVAVILCVQRRGILTPATPDPQYQASCNLLPIVPLFAARRSCLSHLANQKRLAQFFACDGHRDRPSPRTDLVLTRLKNLRYCFFPPTQRRVRAHCVLSLGCSTSARPLR